MRPGGAGPTRDCGGTHDPHRRSRPLSLRFDRAALADVRLDRCGLCDDRAARDLPARLRPARGAQGWHFMLGLSVLALVWLRIAARLAWPAPAPDANEPAWRRLAAHAVHAVLYLFMIAMPVAGWLILSAEGDRVLFFGLELPALTGPDEAFAERIESLHELGGTL